MQWPTGEKVVRALVVALRAFLLALLASVLAEPEFSGVGTFFGSLLSNLPHLW